MFNLNEEKTSLKALTMDTYDSLNKINSLQNMRQEHLNLLNVRMTPPHLCLYTNIGGQITPDKYEYKESKFLMEECAKHVYQKVEAGSIIDINM